MGFTHGPPSSSYLRTDLLLLLSLTWKVRRRILTSPNSFLVSSTGCFQSMGLAISCVDRNTPWYTSISQNHHIVDSYLICVLLPRFPNSKPGCEAIKSIQVLFSITGVRFCFFDEAIWVIGTRRESEPPYLEGMSPFPLSGDVPHLLRV